MEKAAKLKSKIGNRHITEIHRDLCRQGEFFAKAAKHVAEYRDDVNQQNRGDQHGNADYADWVNHGALDSMLSKIADFYDDEVDTAVSNLTALMEPLVIVFLGVVIGGLVVAMYLPIFQLGSILN